MNILVTLGWHHCTLEVCICCEYPYPQEQRHTMEPLDLHEGTICKGQGQNKSYSSANGGNFDMYLLKHWQGIYLPLLDCINQNYFSSSFGFSWMSGCDFFLCFHGRCTDQDSLFLLYATILSDLCYAPPLSENIFPTLKKAAFRVVHTASFHFL